MKSISRYLALTAAALLLVACNASAPAFKGKDISGVDWGKDVSLQAHTGKRVSTADFRGRAVALFFGYTHCPDICAPTLAKLAAVRKNLSADADKLQVLFITVDPARDTPQQLAGFVPKFDASFIGLTGKPEEITAAAAEYKVAYTAVHDHANHQAMPATVDHSGAVLVKDSKGKLRLLFQNDMSIADMEHDLRLLLKER